MSYDGQYQTIALRLGLVFVGAILIIGVVNQHRTGETFGLSGKGRVRRDEEPVYFAFLFLSRLILGPIAMLLGLLLPW